MVKIGVISSYPEIQVMLDKITPPFPCELLLRVPVLDYAIKPALELEREEKVNIIITTQTTAERIKSHITIPIVTLKLRDINLINAFYKASKEGQRLAFAEYAISNTAYNFEYVQELLGYDVRKYTFHDVRQVPEVLDQIMKSGQDVIVTSAKCMIKAATKCGIPAVLIEWDKSDILEALTIAGNAFKRTL